MHAGSIENPDTAAHRVYRVLKSINGAWIGGWELSQRAQTTCASTRVSEIRGQLFAETWRKEKIECERRAGKFFVATPGQLDLLVPHQVSA